jgi:hypothetical protein
VTYNIPTTEGSVSDEQKCIFAGDNLRALSSTWWGSGPEARIAAGVTGFSTDCSLMCGGIQTSIPNVQATGKVEVYGFERDPVTLDETPVKLNTTINIQGF